MTNQSVVDCPPSWRDEHLVEMTDADRGALWRQRLFEAEAGMTRLIADRLGRNEADPSDLTEWLRTRSAMFADLPSADAHDPTGWQTIFFRAQALMERFVVGRFGHATMRAWTQRSSELHGVVEPSPSGSPVESITRLARQCELYGSTYELAEAGDDHAALEISHCAIWDYRERARRRGVTLTLESPCEYCTQATSANIAAKGFRADYELTESPSGHGCRWQATTPRRGGC